VRIRQAWIIHFDYMLVSLTNIEMASLDAGWGARQTNSDWSTMGATMYLGLPMLS
jgi:hypothetical protein